MKLISSARVSSLSNGTSLGLSLTAILSIWIVATTTTITPTNAFVSQLSSGQVLSKRTNTRLYYDIQRDPPNENVWSVLANTEKWIASTLKHAEQTSSSGNPLSRKEVSYVCETSQDPAMILANIFRKLKEARQLGETHGQDQEELAESQENYVRATLRQTQILVIPASEDLNDFQVFDQLVNAINEARRAARDYVTDHSLERLDEKLYGDDEDKHDDKEWVVSVNCAHLHPKFGEKTPEQQLKELQEEDNEGEVDLNLQEYKERRLLARRSPYPSIVVEVRSMAPPEFTPPPPKTPQQPQAVEDDDDGVKTSADDVKIDSEFVQQLEALFSKSSIQKEGDGFYDSIGSHIETFSSVTPMMVAQNWIDQNDPLFDVTKCAFTVSDATYVDEAYEFVFTNLAMQTSHFLSKTSTAGEQAGAQRRQYLVMPHFLSNSATSMEKFSDQVLNIVRTLPPVRNKVDVSFLHPEHVDENKRCPIPVFVLQWKD
ncbi:hypothetical protein IV203_020673 [Nitzschia inconspicua]|uniref:Uncharacterized protein n=1 Tax=Nitzschia inconspicua TaxID=303405 RepID=A0A9K3KGX6_9STRA|nr:hypothetical protein IV203_020667 [Nitzschia inconspicua]KAG7342729.1 hypothetical protein IV203_020673 [Nitzschia inconspicua]